MDKVVLKPNCCLNKVIKKASLTVAILFIYCFNNCLVIFVVNGGWSEWSTWTNCSAACGNGTQNATRTCDNPAPAHNGQQCSGDSHKQKICLIEECPQGTSDIKLL